MLFTISAAFAQDAKQPAPATTTPSTCADETARFNAEMTTLEEKHKDSTDEVAAKAFLEAGTAWRANLRPQLLRADTMHMDCWRLAAMIALDTKDTNLATHALEAFTRLNVKDIPAESMAALEAASDATLLARIALAREAFARTLSWIEKANANGANGAKGVDLCDIAEAYALGVAIPTDHVAANDYFQRAVDKGSARAMWRLGARVQVGIGCDADRAKGLALMVRSAEAGDAMGCLYAGRALITGDTDEADRAKGAAFLQKGADAGDADCALLLANFLSMGTTLPKDTKRAISLAEKAAGSGTEETNLLAALLAADLHRECVSEDANTDPKNAAPSHYDTSIKFYRMVLESENDLLKGDARLGMGDMLIRHTGRTDEELESGLQLMNDAIASGNGRAILALADHYATGTYIEKDLEKAFALWKASHEDDTNAEGTYLLAVAYRDGLGTESDAAEARRLMKQAAEMGNDNAIKAWKEMEEK
jgi:TPR repeat protein